MGGVGSCFDRLRHEVKRRPHSSPTTRPIFASATPETATLESATLTSDIAEVVKPAPSCRQGRPRAPRRDLRATSGLRGAGTSQ